MCVSMIGKHQRSAFSSCEGAEKTATNHLEYEGASVCCDKCFAITRWTNLWISLSALQPLPVELMVPALVFQRRITVFRGIVILRKLLHVDHVFIPHLSGPTATVILSRYTGVARESSYTP